MTHFFLLVFFFFKQKKAYEMRISDWSSDVCSSDLLPHHQRVAGAQIGQRLGKTGPVGPSTRRLIVENTIASCPLQSVMLERELLVGGGDPRIADQAQSARSCDFGHLGEHVGNGLVVVDDRPCEDRKSTRLKSSN